MNPSLSQLNGPLFCFLFYNFKKLHKKRQVMGSTFCLNGKFFRAQNRFYYAPFPSLSRFLSLSLVPLDSTVLEFRIIIAHRSWVIFYEVQTAVILILLQFRFAAFFKCNEMMKILHKWFIRTKNTHTSHLCTHIHTHTCIRTYMSFQITTFLN